MSCVKARAAAGRHPTRTPGRTEVDRTSLAYVGAKYIWPVQPWWGRIGRAPRFVVRRWWMVGQMDIVGTRRGGKYFARTTVVWGRIGRAPRFMAWRCLMVGRMEIVGTRRGEIFFARTFMVRRRVVGATIHGVAMFDGWAIAHGWHTYGRKIFRPYTCGALLHWGAHHDSWRGDV